MNTPSFSSTPWWQTQPWWMAVIIILHAVGIGGIALGYADLLLPWTPMNLVICAGIVMAYTGDESPWRWALTMFLGFAIEVIGVTTGLLFGSYAYGSGLGPKALEVPLLMGVLWWLLLLGTHHWADRLLRGAKRPYFRAALAAIMMTALDGLIEPVAIRAGWWKWDAVDIPWTNYFTWWVAAFLLGCLWRDVEDLKTNQLAGLLVLVFVVFFLSLNLISWS